ncbi:hypothetical protein VNO77_44045 [Canavalia gladiata]|uniref:Uncharacterized protein n=1 Tax=Canavalia gladiata TaxID=3824 RepID=A0AAN9PQ08_CANGL
MPSYGVVGEDPSHLLYFSYPRAIIRATLKVNVLHMDVGGALRSPGSGKINPCTWYRDTGRIPLVSSWVKFPLSQNRVCHVRPQEKPHMPIERHY